MGLKNFVMNIYWQILVIGRYQCIWDGKNVRFNFDITEISKQPTKLPSPPTHKTFDFGSEDDSEVDSITVENTWLGDSDSDDDSVDSEMENPLKHAGAYSAEEVIRIMRDKLIRLQKLYIGKDNVKF